MAKEQDFQPTKQPSAAFGGTVAGTLIAAFWILPSLFAGGKEVPVMSDQEAIGALLLFPVVGAAIGTLVDWFRRWL